MVSGESKDGKWLYFTRGYEAGLWRIPTAGGVETKVLDQPAAGYWGYWAITHKGIYYLDVQAGNAAISLYDPETRKVSRFARLDRMPPQNAGISVRAGDKELLITDLRNAESHITVAESLP
jgi:sugar lactone lactonase YvrE